MELDFGCTCKNVGQSYQPFDWIEWDRKFVPPQILLEIPHLRIMQLSRP